MSSLEIPKQNDSGIIGKKKSESPPRVRSPKEDILISREKTRSEQIGRGVTNSSFVELKDDGKGVFKTAFYENERSAYLIDRFLGINLTPPTAVRMLDGEIGSMQEFIPDAKSWSEFQEEAYAIGDYGPLPKSLSKKRRSDLMKMWVFDLIIGNFDRHSGNFLIQGDTLYAIDHGHSIKHNGSFFLEKMYLYNGYHQFFDEELPQELVEGIKNFLGRPEEQQILEDLLSELIGEEYASACLKCIQIIGGMLVQDGKITKPHSFDTFKDTIRIT